MPSGERHLNGPGRAKRAMPAARTPEPALAWRYPTRTPARVMITSPPAPGRATAASAHSETGSTSPLKTCRENDCTSIGLAPAGASGAIPDIADACPSAITSSGATSVAALPANGTPELPASGGPEISASGRPSGDRDGTDAPAARDSPVPATPPTPATTGCTPAMPNKKEKRSEGSCASRTTAPATEREHVLNQRDDIRNWRHPGDAHQEGIKVGLQLRDRYTAPATEVSMS